MARKHRRRIGKRISCGILSFILSVTLFMLSVMIVLEATAFNPEFILDNMNASNYFIDKKEEISMSLTDLGYASGLDESFFDGLIDEVMLNSNTQTYLHNYYSGESKRVDTTEFKQIFNQGLDDYIKKNDIKNVDDYAREYLVNQAATIYLRSIEIPLFSTISAYFLKAKQFAPFIVTGLVLFAGIIVLILFLANTYKHRAIKYCCYATSASFLTLGIIPLAAFLSDIFKKINIPSRALYNLFVKCSNSLMVAFIFCSVLFLVISVGLYFYYRKRRNKIKNST